MNKRKVLISLTSLMLAMGLVLGTIPFFGSFRPNSGALNDYLLSVNLEELQPGEVLEVNWQGKVLVLRRTPEQIEWLKNYSPPKLDRYYDGIHKEFFP